MTLEQKIKDYFDRFKEAVEVFVAGEEEFLFHKRGSAESYGKGEFKTFTRAEIEVAASTPVPTPEAGTQSAPAPTGTAKPKPAEPEAEAEGESEPTKK